MKKAMLVIYLLIGLLLLLLPAPAETQLQAAAPVSEGLPRPEEDGLATESEPVSGPGPKAGGNKSASVPTKAELPAAALSGQLTRLYAPPVPGFSHSEDGETVLSAAGGGGSANIPPTMVSPQGRFLPEVEEELLEKINRWRREAGCGELESMAALQRSARLRAQEMAQSGCFSHTRPDGSLWNTALPAPETFPCPLRGEIFGMAQGLAPRRAAARWLDEWAGSPSERENLCLPEFDKVGIGVYAGSGEEGALCGVLIFSGTAGSGQIFLDSPAAQQAMQE